jgi:hypothetical protein
MAGGMKEAKKYPTIAVCGLDCGLCPRYYTNGISRCPGCYGLGFSDKHPPCFFITCAVKKKNFEVCAECPEFPCPRFKSDKEYRQLKENSSYPSYKKVLPNLNFIKKYGIKKFIGQQKRRIKLLETIIENFDDGRSKSFFCKAVCLNDFKNLENALNKAKQKIEIGNIKKDDTKTKAKILRESLSGSKNNKVKKGLSAGELM